MLVAVAVLYWPRGTGAMHESGNREVNEDVVSFKAPGAVEVRGILR